MRNKQRPNMSLDETFRAVRTSNIQGHIPTPHHTPQRITNMTLFSNELNSSFQSLSIYRENVTIKANEFQQPGDDYRMVHIQYGSTNLCLCLTRPLDVYAIPVQLTGFPFGEWTPREDEPLVTADQWEAEPMEPYVDDLKELGLIF